MIRRPPRPTLLPYATLFRSGLRAAGDLRRVVGAGDGDVDDLGGETAIVVVDLHGEAVGERLADGERIDRAAVADRVMPGAAGIDAGGAVGGGDADRQGVGVGGVDVFFF